jgi:hypothetical protein
MESPIKPKHPGGRPPLYKHVKDMQSKIDDYFDSCWTDKIIEITDKNGNITTTNSRYQHRPYTVMGLILALGFTCRKQFKEYKAKQEFTNALNAARTKIEMNVEEYLLQNKNAVGPIFWLKNNAEEKYCDRTELEHSGAIDMRSMSDDELDARIEQAMEKHNGKKL